MRKWFCFLALSTAIFVGPAIAQEPVAPPAALKPSQYPIGATPVTNSANVAASAAVATLPGVQGKTTFICGAQFTGSGATTALVVNATISGVISGTMNYTYVATAGVLLVDQPIAVSFFPCIPASGLNTAIVVTLPSLGAGNTNAAVSAQGYQL